MKTNWIQSVFLCYKNRLNEKNRVKKLGNPLSISILVFLDNTCLMFRRCLLQKITALKTFIGQKFKGVQNISAYCVFFFKWINIYTIYHGCIGECIWYELLFFWFQFLIAELGCKITKKLSSAMFLRFNYGANVKK